MKVISVIGLGYVGLPFSIFLAENGYKVIGIDIDIHKINALKKGEAYLSEPGVQEGLKKHKNRLIFTSSYLSLKELKVNAIFICVGTPYVPRKGVDLSGLFSAISSIMEVYQKDFPPIIIRSTVPPGTTKKVGEVLGNSDNVFFMPEFLREGMALEDIRNPNKIVIGMCGEISEKRIPKVVKEIYPPKKYKYIITNTETAEFIKYSQNMIYGLKISYINELQRLAEILERKGLRIDILKVYENFKVCRGVNPSFLKPGLGFSGPCLPKDIKCFLHYISNLGYTSNLIKSILRINRFSFENFIKRVIKMIKKHKIRKLGILGLTFKPGTDDVRNSHSVFIVKKLLQKNRRIFLYLYDPLGIENAKKIFKGNKRIFFCSSLRECIKRTEGLVVLTEWEEFKVLDKIKKPILWGRYIL